jgi:ribosome-associated translation inhibitor RaiA
MQVLFNYHAGVSHSDTLEDHARHQIDHSIGRHAGRVTRVEVHIADDNAHKHGPSDKRCMLEARPAGMHPIAVESRAADFYAAVSDAAGKLGRALAHRLERKAI